MPANLLLLGAQDVARVVQDLDLMEPLANALVSYSSGEANSPPRTAAEAPQGFLGAMPSHLPGRALAAKLISVFPNNARRGLASNQGLLALLNEQDGTPLCVMDARHITAVRTAVVSALSVRELARTGARVLAILGTGEQAAAYLSVVPKVRDFAELRIAGRNRDHLVRLIGPASEWQVCPSFEVAVRGADVVLCCTDSAPPLLRLSWLSRGAHVVSVGSGSEIDESTLRESWLFVEWRGAVTNPPPAGAAELQGLNPDIATELGEVLAGSQPGRLSSQEVTVFESTGLGVEDAAVGWAVYEAALRVGLGVPVRW
ncbi:MAG TPA: ornithine cyclodeaminase family protein [Candidatus Dormibacteraeota bacterium]|nr:ornithine cyclodeaminase family protein [Candidatus Dormibacteraeota bacterium]